MLVLEEILTYSGRLITTCEIDMSNEWRHKVELKHAGARAP